MTNLTKSIEKFKIWHTNGTHDFDSGCSCNRCETIHDYLIQQWADGTEITHEMVGDWYIGRDYTYETTPETIEFTNKMNWLEKKVAVHIDNPEFGAIFIYARQIGYTEA